MQQIVDFILELDKLKAVTRKTRPIGQDRYENAAEHSWQIALFAFSLAQFANETIDITRVVYMLLVHDIGEIDAGDKFFYANEGWAECKLAEQASVTRIFGLLPSTQQASLMSLWQEFEDAQTPEARFAHAADRAMPVLLNLANHGQSWKENGVSYEQVLKRVGPPIKAGCPALWSYLETRLESAYTAGWFGMGADKTLTIKS